MKSNEIVKLRKGFFLTEASVQALDSYKQWAAANGGDDESIKAREEKLAKRGLVKSSPPPLKAGKLKDDDKQEKHEHTQGQLAFTGRRLCNQV